ncbi:HAMP domain-containing sensor histidine kinase [Lachnospiraceae bacterium 62-35]
MTKKLRYKFIWITMSIITIMLCIIMSMIYFFTKMNLENNSINMLQNIAMNPFLQRVPGELSDDVRLPYFTIQISIQGDLIATGGGYYDLSDENFLKDLTDAAFSNSAITGVIKEYKLRYYRLNTPISQILVYADISSEQVTLSNLLRNCMIIGLICFLIFLAISFMLASWVVRPVDKAWEQQRRFIADASHELKTPLTVIMTNAELMQNPDYDEENRTTFASSILVMSKQMRSLVEQMLELAHADSIQSDPVFSPVNFSQIVSDAILPFEPIFFEKGLTLQTDIAENVMINGDPSQLHQVVDILLDNAGKYSCEKGKTVVTLRNRGKGHCLLMVADEGKEISAKDLEHLFKRFYRADQARSRTGSFGLGLSIAESIVLRHKGKIWAESSYNINTFFVEFEKSAFCHFSYLSSIKNHS